MTSIDARNSSLDLFNLAFTSDMQDPKLSLQEEFEILDDSEKEEWMCRKKLQANRLFRKELYDKAFDSFHEAILAASLMNSNAEIVVLLCNLATCKLAMNQPYSAYKLASSAIELNSKFARAYERRAAASIKLLQFDSAIEDIETASNLDPDEGVKQKLTEYVQYLKKVSASSSYDDTRDIQNSDEEDTVPLLDYISWVFNMPSSFYRKLRSSCTRRSRVEV